MNVSSSVRSSPAKSSSVSVSPRTLSSTGLALEPEKEPLYIDSTKLDPEYFYHLQSVLRIAQEELWHWKRFPIVLPEPVSQRIGEQRQKTRSSTLSRKKTLRLKDLFIQPNFAAELKTLSCDANGIPRKLNQAQLKSVRETGEFVVDSLQFPGQKHRWIVSQFLVKGRQKSLESLQNDLSKSLYLIYSTSRNFLIGHTFSLFASANGWSQGVLSLLDLLIGLPTLEPGNVQQKLLCERSKFLVAELISTSPPESQTELIRYLSSLLRNNLVLDILPRLRVDTIDSSSTSLDGVGRDKTAHPHLLPPPASFQYRTPNGLNVDLRLFSQDVMSSAKPHLLHILNTSLHGWFVERKQQLSAELNRKASELSRTVSQQQLEREANEAVEVEYLDRVCRAVSAESALRAIGPDVPELLVQQVKTCLVIQAILQEMEANVTRHVIGIEERLKARYPILSRIRPWLRRQLHLARSKYVTHYQWQPHLRAIEKCRALKLDQHAYFLSRDLTFRRDREPVLRKELEQAKTPRDSFVFRKKIWRPNRYIVKLTTFESGVGSDEKVVPTVMAPPEEEPPLCMDNPRRNPHAPSSSLLSGSNSERYTVTRHTQLTNTTRYPFWRWTNFCLRTYVWLCNVVFCLGVVVPFCSPVSLRALVEPEPFFPDIAVNQTSGRLQKDPLSRTHTIRSRLHALWRHIRESRKEFESQPDTGLLPKGLMRHFSRFINYVVKGAFGSFLLLVVLPPLFVILVLASLFLAVTAPAWLPLASVLLHVVCLLFYDLEFHSFVNSFLAIFVVNIFFLGMVQPLVSILVAFVVCPLTSLVLAIYAFVRKGLRDVWDCLMFNTILQKRARIPSNDNFLARRIGGPGLAADYFYQIKPEQALVALETKMELLELEAFGAETRRKICEPQENYHSFIEKMFGIFGVQASRKVEGPCKQLEQEGDKLLSDLGEKISARTEQLYPDLPSSVTSKIRLFEANLRTVLNQGVLMVKDFFPASVFSRMSADERLWFWEERELVVNDWLGLTCQLLEEFFSPEFLAPLQDADVFFQLQVANWNLSRLVDMTMETNWSDELDLTQVIYAHKMPKVIRQPDIPLESFNPDYYKHEVDSLKTYDFSTRWHVYKKERRDVSIRLQNPVPIPHPLEIAMVIHSRDSTHGFHYDENLLRQQISHVKRLPQKIVVDWTLKPSCASRASVSRRSSRSGSSGGSRRPSATAVRSKKSSPPLSRTSSYKFKATPPPPQAALSSTSSSSSPAEPSEDIELMAKDSSHDNRDSKGSAYSTVV